MKFKLSDYLTTNILSFIGWVVFITTCFWHSPAEPASTSEIADCYVYFVLLHLFNAFAIVVIVLFLFPLEIFLSIKFGRKLLAIPIKNIYIKIIYWLLFYTGLMLSVIMRVIFNQEVLFG